MRRGFRTISCFISILSRRLRWSQTVTTSANSNSPGCCPLPLLSTAGVLALALAYVLASPRAVEIGIYVVLAFVQLRQASSVHADLAKRLTDLELTIEQLELSHDTFSRNTRNQLRQVFEALRELTTPPEPPKRPIGFVTPQDKPTP